MPPSSTKTRRLRWWSTSRRPTRASRSSAGTSSSPPRRAAALAASSRCTHLPAAGHWFGRSLHSRNPERFCGPASRRRSGAARAAQRTENANSRPPAPCLSLRRSAGEAPHRRRCPRSPRRDGQRVHLHDAGGLRRRARAGARGRRARSVSLPAPLRSAMVLMERCFALQYRPLLG